MKAPWVQITKLRNTSTTHSHEPARPSTHTPTERPTLTHQPTHPRRAIAIQQYVKQHMRWYVPSLSPVSCWDFHCFTILCHPGERANPSPGGRFFKAPARRVGHRRPFFRRGLRGLLCGSGVEPPRGRGRPSGARESQLFLGYVTTKIFSKILLDMTTATEQHYI